MTSSSIEKRSCMSLLSFWLAFKVLKPIFNGTTLTIYGVEATPEK